MGSGAASLLTVPSVVCLRRPAVRDGLARAAGVCDGSSRRASDSPDSQSGAGAVGTVGEVMESQVMVMAGEAEVSC